MALLEADVHYKVVKQLVAVIKTRALGQEVMGSLTPGQQVIKIVNEELTELMGTHHEDLRLTGAKPVSVMLIGLQGSGKNHNSGQTIGIVETKRKNPLSGSSRCLSSSRHRPVEKDRGSDIGSGVSISSGNGPG